MIYNDAPLSFEVTSRTKTNLKTGIQFSTQDIETARLIFTITKDGVPLPLSAVSGKLVMCMADGSRFIRNVEIIDAVGGIAQYVLTADEIKHYGAVNAELNLYYANNQALSVHKFTFLIDRALIDVDIVPIAEYYIDDFEALREKINVLYDEAISTIEELRKKFEDLENIETKAGAQAKADAAEKNAKSYMDTHTKRTDNPHLVTKAQVGLDKVDNVQQASKTEFDTHNADSSRHVVQADKDKWNGAQLSKITADHGGVSIAANEGEDILQKIVDQGRAMGTFYAHGKATNAPSTVSTRGIFHLTGLSSDGKGMYGWVYATDYKNNVFTNYYDGSTTYWQGWKSLETETAAQAKADKALSDAKNYTDSKVSQLVSAWVNISLINGAVTDAAAPLRYRLKNGGDEIQLNGGFKSSFSTIIATGLPKIKNPIEFLVATVGTYGFLRMDYRTNGDLYLAGGTVNSEAGISKISVNVTIPVS